ncbi:protein translocase subunit SecD [Calderihabitans maritimus]|uniref:Protein translocase subunit SecD n=1 Tax=Calderihabitans maritimus TaxID=1246530 RepID=A0A1Z5HT45_9FIRM|nr:protein translocase subunit SecD [Calderihabitans maritimus]GAW92703.1 preprotein translocase subunit SecD [Calderihabitans maritimus]
MNWGKFFQVTLIIVAVIAVAVASYTPIKNNLNLGLDLQGGVHVRLQALDTPENPVEDADMVQLKAVMRQRVDELGLSEPVIQREGRDRLIIEIAGVDNPEEAVKVIGKTAFLEFKTADGETILTGKDLKDAKAVTDPNTNEPEIALEFKAEGTKKFAEVTARLSQQYPENDPRRRIGIYLDGELLTNPEVREPIPSGKAVITGNRSFDEAAKIAALLRGGALPVKVEIIEKRTVGPTLGKDSLEKSKAAGLYGIAAIMLFMLLYYRIPGLVADFSLILYGIIVMGVMVLLKAVLTLPGIAGLILSVGMAVDANIIIFERIKEELRNGKTLRASIESGFRRAFWTIFDANVTTLIAAVILYHFGSGPIRGFAVTLSLGILASMFTAITFTRFMLRNIAETNLVRHKWLYGA